jgi:aldose sugar dehydrogenase
VLLAAACLVSAGASAQSVAPDAQRIAVDVVASGLVYPWALAFLPDGRMLVTERPGALRIVTSRGEISAPIADVPAVQAEGQGGLLDVALDPQFASNRALYLSYAERGAGGAGTAVARAELTGERLTNVRVIFRQQPKVSGRNHFGSRLVPRGDGTLFVALGDRFTQRERAQDLTSTIGKVVRIGTDGSIPADNPFVKRPGALPEIWSLGHRNIQGAALDPETGQLHTVEHGALGGDEFNEPRAGRNYGWPVITYGRDYSGARIGVGTERAGLEQPLHYWDPSIAPSGLVRYNGSAFPAWRGDWLVGSMKFTHLARLRLRDGRVAQEYRYLQDRSERIRDVREGPDGFVYLLTDSPEGRLLRLRPAAAAPPAAAPGDSATR